MLNWNASARYIEEAAVGYMATNMGRHVRVKRLSRKNAAKCEVDVVLEDRFTDELWCVPVGRWETPEINGGWAVIANPHPVAAMSEVVRSLRKGHGPATDIPPTALGALQRPAQTAPLTPRSTDFPAPPGPQTGPFLDHRR
jgi:hypothetical protein